MSRMVAFRASLSCDGQQQLQAVLLARSRHTATRLEEMMELSEADREQVRLAWVYF